MIGFHERRRHRSDQPLEALTLQLRASADGEGLEALVLAGHDGVVIAQSAASSAGHEVAAYGPYLAQRRPWAGTIACATGAQRVAIVPVALGVHSGFLCAVGIHSTLLRPTVLRTTEGVRRILAI